MEPVSLCMIINFNSVRNTEPANNIVWCERHVLCIILVYHTATRCFSGAPSLPIGYHFHNHQVVGSNPAFAHCVEFMQKTCYSPCSLPIWTVSLAPRFSQQYLSSVLCCICTYEPCCDPILKFAYFLLFFCCQILDIIHTVN